MSAYDSKSSQNATPAGQVVVAPPPLPADVAPPGVLPPPAPATPPAAKPPLPSTATAPAVDPPLDVDAPPLPAKVPPPLPDAAGVPAVAEVPAAPSPRPGSELAGSEQLTLSTARINEYRQAALVECIQEGFVAGLAILQKAPT